MTYCNIIIIIIIIIIIKNNNDNNDNIVHNAGKKLKQIHNFSAISANC